MKISGDKSPSFRSMEDLEHVLRFFTVHAGWEQMRHPLGEEMDLFMSEHRNGDTNRLRGEFVRALDGCEW
jgi:hypothetical protein